MFTLHMKEVCSNAENIPLSMFSINGCDMNFLAIKSKFEKNSDIL